VEWFSTDVHGLSTELRTQSDAIEFDMSGDTCGTAMGGALCSPVERGGNDGGVVVVVFEDDGGVTETATESCTGTSSSHESQVVGPVDLWNPLGNHAKSTGKPTDPWDTTGLLCDSDPASTSNLYDSRRGHGVRRASHMSKGCGSPTSRGERREFDWARSASV
jgi:hypothetical protein